MTVYQFAASAGSVLSWSMVDQLIFSNVYTAGSLQFTQQGPDLVVSCQGVSVTLATTTIQNLSSSSFLFQDGSQLKIASAGGELLNGSQLSDFILGRDGNDSVSGSSGSDQLYGGSGNDTLCGGEGGDVIYGEDGDDILYGSSQADASSLDSRIVTTLVASGLSQPVYAASRPGDPTRLLIAETGSGLIKILDLNTGSVAATPFLDVNGPSLPYWGAGLFSFAFSPNYQLDRTIYALHLTSDGFVEICSYQASLINPDKVDSSSLKVIMRIQNQGGHYGGWMGFGPDGYLYITSGDGNNGGDPINNAQNIDSLLGKILRIDVNSDAFPADPYNNYAIPSDNPFVNAPAADEIWALGLRNPWRASFDRQTGDFYIADVGQALREEINLQLAGSSGGANYGWKVKEGFLVYDNTIPGNPPATTPPLTDPIYDYAHGPGPYGGYSVTGGYVYRGQSPGMLGVYFFADYVSNQLWSFRVVNGKVVDLANRTSQLRVQSGVVDQIVSFAEDGFGNLYVIGLDGDIFKLDPRVGSGDLADTIDGGHGNDLIYGGAGDDLLQGGSGNDTLQGGHGHDTIDGGPGSDTISYEGKRSDYSVLDLDNNGLRVFDLRAGAPEGSDLFSNVEFIAFFDGTFDLASIIVVQGVTITGSSGSDVITASSTTPGQYFPTSRGDTINGLGGNDLISGLGGDDRLDGGAGNDTLVGGAGNDTYVVDAYGDIVDESGGDGIDTVETTLTFSLASTTQVLGSVENLRLLGTANSNGTGNALANRLTGTSGNNILQGLAGADSLDGGLGLDTASYAASAAAVSVSLISNSGSGGDAEGDVLISMENITGSNFNDTLIGNSADNVLNGGLGIDTVSYAAASAGVTVNLGLSTAQNTSAAGTDTLMSIENLIGSAFDDVLSGSNVANLILGGSGNDSLNGGAGNDTLLGGAGNDTYVVDTYGDIVDESGGDGSDTVEATFSFSLASTTQILGSVENLRLLGTANSNGTGNALANRLTGNSGNNILQGLAGADSLDGGLGLDTASYAASAAAVSVSLLSNSGSGGDAEGDVLISIENITGSNFNDTLIGNSADNVLNGGLGIDTVSYAAASAGVTLNLALSTAQNTSAAGTDTLMSIENLIGSAFDDALSGSNVANLILGGSGNDNLNGGAGNDTLIGGAGNDTYVVDAYGDIVDESSGDGSDTVEATFSFSLASATQILGSVENLRLLGTANSNGTGNALANRLTGNSGNNILQGLAGADSLDGGLGLDTASYSASAAAVSVSLISNSGSGGDAEGDVLISMENITGSNFNDTLIGNSADNVLNGGLGIDTVSYAAASAGVTVNLGLSTAQNTSAAGTDTLMSIENLIGSAFDDALSGSNGANLISGGLGNDRLNGGSDNDTLNGGDGSDMFRFDTPLSSTANRDIITDFNPSQDRIELENSVFSALAATGTLDNLAFTTGTQATTAQHRIIYNILTGVLIYDSNGSVSGGSTIFAELTPGLALSAAHFIVT